MSRTESALEESLRKPDFFIVGAPKCGTTAMNDYLKQHPEIFMSEGKDVLFFGSDLHSRYRPTSEKYSSFFSKVNGEKRVGEASVWYLYSRRAAVEIKEFSPSASIIIMLRNPVDMLYSQHSEFLFNGTETIVDFEAALAAEDDRKQGRRIPPSVLVVESLFYRETAAYSEQVRRYFHVFGRERTHIILFDDFVRDTAAVYRDTLQFLGVDTEFCPNLRVVNPNKVVQNRRLHNFLVNPPQIVVRAAKAVVPRSMRGRLIRRVRELNARSASRPPLDPNLRRVLQNEFAPEVERLSHLLDRDLRHWVTN